MWNFLGCFGLLPLALVVAGAFWLRQLQRRLETQQTEIAQLREGVSRLRFELRHLKREQPTLPDTVVEAEHETLELPDEPTDEIPVSSEPAEPSAPTAQAAPAPRVPPKRTQPPVPPRPRLTIDWEQWIGVRGAAVAGAVVAALAGVLFLKYTIERGILTPVTRVVLSYLGGTATLVFAELVRRRGYRPTAEALSGAGVVILYAATWAARARYDLISFPVSFALMTLVTLAGGFLAWRHRAMSTAYLGLIGGFATPLLLTSDLENPIGLFGYLLLLNIGVWLLARRNGWYTLAFLSQAATFFYQASWIGLEMERSRSLVGLLILGVFAVFFTLVAQRGQDGDDANSEDRGERAKQLRLQVSGLLAPFTLGFYYAAHSDLTSDPLAFIALIALVSAMACWISIVRSRPWIATGAVAADLALIVVWSSNDDLDVTRSWQLAGMSIALALLFHLRQEWVAWRQGYAAPKRVTSGSETIPSLLAAGGLLTWSSVVLGLDGGASFTAWLTAAIVLGAMMLRQSGISREEYHPIVAAAAVTAGFLGPFGRTAVAPGSLNPGTPAATTLYLIAIACGAALFVWGLWGQRGDAPSQTGVFSAALLGGGVLSFALGDRGLSVVSFYAVTAVLALLVVLVATRLASGALFALAALLLLGNHAMWIADAGLPVPGAGPALGAQALAVIFFTLWPWTTRATWLAADSTPQPTGGLLSFPERGSGRTIWIAAALAGPAWFLALRQLWLERFGDGAIGLLPLAIGALAYFAVRMAARAAEMRLALVWSSAVALGSVALAIPLQLEKEWVTVGWSLDALAMLWLWRRLRHPGLAWFGLALHGAVVLRLLFNPAVLSYYPAGGLPVLNWLAYTYLVPAASLVASSVLLTREAESGDDSGLSAGLLKKLSSGIGGAAILVVFAWINLTVFDAFAEGDRLTFDLRHRPARDLTLSIAWAVYALALLGLGLVRKAAGLRWASLVFLVLTILKVFLYDLGELTDLYRVASLVGLAVSLIVVSLLYQRFVFGDRAQS